MVLTNFCLTKIIPAIIGCIIITVYVYYKLVDINLHHHKSATYKAWPRMPNSTNVTSTADTTISTLWYIPNKTQMREALLSSTEKYHILIWDPPFGKKHARKINPAICGSCYVSYDKERANNSETKAIVFHFAELVLSRMPKERRTDQYYTWWSMEGPPALQLRRRTLKNYDGVFNLTMGYRRDADIYTPYGKAYKIIRKLQASGSGNPIKDIEDLVNRKNQLALWMVSNCGLTEGAKRRLQLVKELIKAGLQVDRRGGCFPRGKPAPRDKKHEIISEFKFYLSFENSIHCRDYITEKLFVNALTHGAVPVVFGAKKSDYQAVAPPNSCIYVDDFETPSDLVKYLLYLDKNVTAYKEYFLWRNMKPEEMPNYGRTTGLCALCRILHGINVDNVYNPLYKERYSSIPLLGFSNQSRIVSSLREWFYGSESRECIPKY